MRTRLALLATGVLGVVLAALYLGNNLGATPAPVVADTLDLTPIEVPERYSEPGRGGSRVAFAAIMGEDGKVHASGNVVEFYIKRQLKILRWHDTFFRDYIRVVKDNASCCGDTDDLEEPEVLNERYSEVYSIPPGTIMNDVIPASIEVPVGTHRVVCGVERLLPDGEWGVYSACSFGVVND